MDQFNSTEDAPTWSATHFNAGREARLAGTGRDSAPTAADVDDFGHKSWIAGWNDAEMGILANAENALCDGSICRQADALDQAVLGRLGEDKVE